MVKDDIEEGDVLNNGALYQNLNKKTKKWWLSFDPML